MDLLKMIASCLETISGDELSQAESNIADILIRHGYLRYNEHNELERAIDG